MSEWRPVPKLFLQYDTEESNPTGLILEHMFIFGKGWKGQKIRIRQLPAAAEWKEQGTCGRAFRAKAFAGLEARVL